MNYVIMLKDCWMELARVCLVSCVSDIRVTWNLFCHFDGIALNTGTNKIVLLCNFVSSTTLAPSKNERIWINVPQFLCGFCWYINYFLSIAFIHFFSFGLVDCTVINHDRTMGVCYTLKFCVCSFLRFCIFSLSESWMFMFVGILL